MNAAPATALIDNEFELDIRVVEDLAPAGALMLDTSDGCGSTCEGTACTSFTGDPA